MNNEYNTLCMSCTRSCKQLAAAIVVDCPKYDYNNSSLPKANIPITNYRELTSSEKKGIKDLVTTMCANYDNHYKECLLLDTACPMLLKHYHNGKLCKYFENAVLPLNSALEQNLKKASSTNKVCATCNTPFVGKGRQVYCSENCRTIGFRNTEKIKKRNQRQNMG